MVVNIDLRVKNKSKYKKGDIVVLTRKDGCGAVYYYQIVYYPHVESKYGLVYLNSMEFDNKYISNSADECVSKFLEYFKTLEVVDVIKAEDVLITTKCN